MASDKNKHYRVTWDGAIEVDVDAMLRDPKVQEQLRKLSRITERLRGKPGVTYLRPIRPED